MIPKTLVVRFMRIYTIDYGTYILFSYDRKKKNDQVLIAILQA